MKAEEVADNLLRTRREVVVQMSGLYCTLFPFSSEINYANHQSYLDSLWSYERLAQRFIPDLHGEYPEVAIAALKKALAKVIPANEKKAMALIHRKFRGYKTVSQYHPGLSQMGEKERREAVRRSHETRGANDYTSDQIEFIFSLYNNPGALMHNGGRDRNKIACAVRERFPDLTINLNGFDSLVRRVRRRI